MCATILNYRLDRVPSPQTQNAAKSLVFQKKRKKRPHLTHIYRTYVRTFEHEDGERRGSTTS